MTHYVPDMAEKRSAAGEVVALQVRVPKKDYNRFVRAAKADDRSLSSWVRDRLRAAADQELAR